MLSSEARNISDHVMLMGNDQFRFYIAGWEKAALIECGASASAWLFAEQWKNLKDKPKVEYLVCLHTHFDHICGLPILKQLFPEAQLIASEPAKELMSKEKIVKKNFVSDALLTQIYLDRKFLSKAPPSIPDLDHISVERTVKEGEVLELDSGLRLKFIYTPGHSTCSMSAYLEPDQVMFTSDTACSQYLDESMIPSFYTGFNEFVGSIKKLTAYPTKVVAPGHGKLAFGEQASQQFYKLAISACQEMHDYVATQVNQVDYDEKTLIANMRIKYIRDVFDLFPAEVSEEGMKVRIRRVKESL